MYISSANTCNGFPSCCIDTLSKCDSDVVDSGSPFGGAAKISGQARDSETMWWKRRVAEVGKALASRDCNDEVVIANWIKILGRFGSKFSQGQKYLSQGCPIVKPSSYQSTSSKLYQSRRLLLMASSYWTTLKSRLWAVFSCGKSALPDRKSSLKVGR